LSPIKKNMPNLIWFYFYILLNYYIKFDIYCIKIFIKYLF
jgi:hypothetical protein